MKESAWKGRNGGLDIDFAKFESHQPRRKALPPLTDTSNNNNVGCRILLFPKLIILQTASSPSRGRSAPDLTIGRVQESFGLTDQPEELITGSRREVSPGKKAKKSKQKRLSETEKRLLER